MKISMPCLRLSSSGVMATCVKMFHISLSGYSKRASNSMSCLMLPSQNCKGESERGNHLNYKFCLVHWTNNWHWLELFEVIPGKKIWDSFLWYQISKVFLNRWKAFQKEKKKRSRQLFPLTYFCYQGNYFIFLKKKKREAIILFD